MRTRMEFISSVAAVFDKHVGRYPKLPTDAVAEACECSADTVARWRSGESIPDAWALFLIAKSLRKHRPEFVQDLFAAVHGDGYSLVRNEAFEKEELDANHDGKVDRVDAMLHQHAASEAAVRKSTGIVAGDNFDVMGEYDSVAFTAASKATQVMRIVTG